MNDIESRLIGDLRKLVANLGKDGGLMSPSIYDTAQGLRLRPPAQGIEPILEWLVSQQQADGGWGNPGAPRARDIPTIAALLALCRHADRFPARRSIASGVAFMQEHSKLWEEGLTEDIPVAAEVLMPVLLEEAAAAGLSIPTRPYAELVRLGQRKRAQIHKLEPKAGTPPVFSWEAWGSEADPTVVDELGSVGHNPTATMAWLIAAEASGVQSEKRLAVERYLQQAANATRLDVPGIYPSAWPLNRFEQSLALYPIFTVNLAEHPALADVVCAQVDDMAQALTPTGLGFSDSFLPDGDDTAAAMTVLELAGYHPSRQIIKVFEQADHFSSYPHELQFSLTVTARFIHALSLKREDTSVWQRFLVRQQHADGRWTGDKWNTSWVYTTCHVLIALRGSGAYTALRRAYNVLLDNQHQDGGWGTGEKSNMTETAYGILALHTLAQEGLADNILIASLRKAHRWLLAQYLATPEPDDKCWLNKELYRPHRIDQAFLLSALLCAFDVEMHGTRGQASLEAVLQ